MKTVKIGDICDVLNGYAFKSSKYTDSGIRIIRISNVQKGYIEDKEPAFYPLDTPAIEKYVLKEGDLLISLTGNVGRVGILPKAMLPAALNQRVACLRIKDNRISKWYLYHLLNSDLFEKRCINSSKGIAQKNMSTEWLKDYEIPLCSQKEQSDIVRNLDLIGKLIADKKSEITELDTLIKSRFVEMFGNLNSNKFDYSIFQLSDFIQFLTSGSRGWAKYCHPGGKEWFITIKNVKDCHVSLKDIQEIDPPHNAEARRTKVQEGDLLISITADLGRTGVITKEIAEHGAYINQHLTCIRLDRNRLNPLYVAYFMESQSGKEQFISKNQSAVKAGLNFDSIKSLKLIVPPLDLQNQFANFVHQVDKSKSSAIHRYCKLIYNLNKQRIHIP